MKDYSSDYRRILDDPEYAFFDDSDKQVLSSYYEPRILAFQQQSILNDPEFYKMSPEDQDVLKDKYALDSVDPENNFWGGVQDIGKMLYDTVTQTKGAIGSLLEDKYINEHRTIADRWREEAEARTEQRNNELSITERNETVLPFKLPFVDEKLTRGNIADASQSSGFSAVATGAGLLGAGVGAIAGAGTGGIPAAATIPATAMATSGAAAYKMQKVATTQQLLRHFAAAKGSELTLQEQRDIIDANEKDIFKSAAWEAGPEAISQVFGVIPGVRNIVKGLSKNALMSLVKGVAGLYGTEIATETVTGIGQQQAESRMDLTDEPERQWSNLADINKTFQEVVAPTLITSSVFAGAGGVMGGAKRVATKTPTDILKTDSVDDAIATFNESMNTGILADLDSKADTDIANIQADIDEKLRQGAEKINQTYYVDPGATVPLPPQGKILDDGYIAPTEEQLRERANVLDGELRQARTNKFDMEQTGELRGDVALEQFPIEAAPAPQPEFQPTKQAKELADEDPHRQAMEEAKKMGGISVEAAKQMFSPDTIKELSKVGLFTKNGQGIDDMATQLGYESANELVDAWSNTGLKKDAVADLQQQEKDEFDRAEDARRLAPVTEQSAEDFDILKSRLKSGDSQYAMTDSEIESATSLSVGQKAELLGILHSNTNAIKQNKTAPQESRVEGKTDDTGAVPEVQPVPTEGGGAIEVGGAEQKPWTNAKVEDETRWQGTNLSLTPKKKSSTGGKAKLFSVYNSGNLLEVQFEGHDGTFRISPQDYGIKVISLKDSKTKEVETKVVTKPESSGIYVGESKEFNATANGQKKMAARASRLATLISLNDKVGGIYSESELNEISDLEIDKIRDHLLDVYNTQKQPQTAKQTSDQPKNTPTKAKSGLKDGGDANLVEAQGEQKPTKTEKSLTVKDAEDTIGDAKKESNYFRIGNKTPLQDSKTSSAYHKKYGKDASEISMHITTIDNRSENLKKAKDNLYKLESSGITRANRKKRKELMEDISFHQAEIKHSSFQLVLLRKRNAFTKATEEKTQESTKKITTKSGQPFKSERSLKANAKRRGITDYTVKQVDGGYVGVYSGKDEGLQSEGEGVTGGGTKLSKQTQSSTHQAPKNPANIAKELRAAIGRGYDRLIRRGLLSVMDYDSAMKLLERVGGGKRSKGANKKKHELEKWAKNAIKKAFDKIDPAHDLGIRVHTDPTKFASDKSINEYQLFPPSVLNIGDDIKTNSYVWTEETPSDEERDGVSVIGIENNQKSIDRAIKLISNYHQNENEQIVIVEGFRTGSGFEEMEDIISDGIVVDIYTDNIEAKFSKETGQIEAFTYLDPATGKQKIVMIDGAIKKGEAYSTLLHEVGHTFLRDAFHGKQWDRLVKSFERHSKNDTPTGKAIRAAKLRVPKDTPGNVKAEEEIAYFLTSEAGQNLPLYKRIMGYIRRALVKMGMPASILQPSDIVEMAKGYLAQQAKATNKGSLLVGIREFAQPAMMSLSKATEKIKGMAAFKEWFGESVVTESGEAGGVPKVLYRGDFRINDVGDTFDIITGDEGGSGGIFFTDDPEIASSYAENKPYVPDEHYDSRNYISVDINGNTVPLNKVRGHLSVKDRQAIDNAVLTFGENEDTYEKEINSENTSIPEYIYNREKKAAHGNVIDAAYTTLIESAALYPSEEFVWFLEQTGVFDKVTYDDPYMSKSAVTPVYVSMQKPIDSNNISNETIKELETILGTDATLDSIKDQRFQTDPDAVVYVTDEFREAALSLGYDGIITRGGTITGGTAHTVYISLRPESVKSIFNRGTWSKTDPNIRHSYAGKKSLTVDESKLQEAIELRKSGEDADTIWQETGWKKAKDNKWRYEIDDSHMEFKTELLEGRIGALAKFIKHKELFEAYPQLKDIEISVKNLGKNNGQYIRGDDFNQARIEINPLNKQKNETLIHEIQHAIQDIEGFAKGGSADFELIKYKKKAKSFDKQVERFNDLLVKAVGTPEYSDIMDKKMSLVTDGLEEKLNDPIALMEKAHTDYKRLLGEVEARDAATRKDLTPKQRRLMPPYVTEGIAEEDMIVRTGDGVMFSVSDTTEKLKEKVGKLFTDDLISAAEIQPQKTDIKVFEPWVSTPEYTLKKAPATARMLDAGLKKSELKTKNEDYILDGIDNNTGAAEYIAKHQSFAKSMTELEKKNPAEYKEANDYLLKVDRTGKAFRLKFKDNVYSVLDKEGKKLKDFDNSPDAVSFLMAAEAKHLLDNGMSGKAIDAVINSRVVLNRGFDVMARDYQKIIDSAAAMGMPEPSVKVEGEDGKTKTITLSEAIAMMGDLRGSYFPRQRERGGVVLKAIKGDKQIRKHFDLYITPGGKKIDFDTGMEIPANKLMEIARKGFNRMTPLGREMMKLQKQGYDMSVEKNVSMPESVFEATQLMTSINAIMEEGLSQAKTNEKLADAYSVLNNILTHSVADIFKARGGLSSRMKRTKSYWEGFETDMKIAVVMYAKGMAATSAKRETAQAITEALTGRDISFDKFKADGLGETYEEFLEFVKDRRLDPKQTPNLYKEAMSWTKEILRNDEQIDRIIGTMKGLAVLKFLGFRVSSAVVNMTNLAQAVPATMASHLDIPINKAMRQVTASLKVLHDYSKGNGSTLDKKIITDLKERGWDNPQFNHENAAVLRSKVGNRYSKFVDLSMAMFGKAEQINRGATIHAAYIQAKRQFPGLKHDALMKKAKSVSDRAHGVYGKETAPVWTRGSGNILRAGYTFKKFSHNYMLNMAEMIGRGKNKEAAYMLLSPAILAGGSASLATPVISGIISALGGGDDPTEEFYQWAEDNLGTDRIFRHGLAGAFGTNLTGSLQLNAPFPTTKDDIFGAPGSVIGDIGKGIKHATKGEGFKAAERLLPAGIGNVFKSIREYNEGATTNSYGPVFYGDEPLKATAADAFLRAISFNPSGLSGKREKQWSEKKIAMKYQDKRSAINSRIKKMLVQNDGRIDRGEWGSILGAIKKYNDIVRGLGRKDIRPIDARKALKRMVRNVNRAPRSERGRVM